MYSLGSTQCRCLNTFGRVHTYIKLTQFYNDHLTVFNCYSTMIIPLYSPVILQWSSHCIQLLFYNDHLTVFNCYSTMIIPLYSPVIYIVYTCLVQWIYTSCWRILSNQRFLLVHSGNIILLKQLDYERERERNIRVTASDGSHVSRMLCYMYCLLTSNGVNLNIVSCCFCHKKCPITLSLSKQRRKWLK